MMAKTYSTAKIYPTIPDPPIEVVSEPIDYVCVDCAAACVFVNKGYNCPVCLSNSCRPVMSARETKE
jgi:hypothetical protein